MSGIRPPPINSTPSRAKPVVPWRRRLLPLATGSYVGALAVWVDGGTVPRAWAMALLALAIALFAARRPEGIARALGWGLAVVVASLGAEAASRGLDACAALGAAVCGIAACVAVTRMPGAGGIVRAAPVSPLPAALVVGISWGAVLASRLAPEREATAWLTAFPHALALGAGGATIAVFIALVEWNRLVRRLELGVVERALGMRGLLGTTCAAALVVTLIGRVRGDAGAWALVAVASVILGAAALEPDAVRVARAARRVVVLAIVGGGVSLLGATAADGR